MEVFREFKIEPIVVVRNIFDVMVSLRDHMFKLKTIFPMSYVDKNAFYSFSKTKQYDCLIEMFSPWYFNFYVSWYRVKRKRQLKTHWVVYDEFIGNEEKVISQILRKMKMEKKKSVDEALAVMKKVGHNYRFNIGVVGRGKKELSIAQRRRIVRFKYYYPDVDFSMIGIE